MPKGKSTNKAKVLRRSSTTPTLQYSLERITKESLALAPSVFAALSLSERRIVMALALEGNNAPHRKVARIVGAFHKSATAKACAKCREANENHRGPCAGNDGWTRVVVSTTGSALKTEKGGSRADRVANIFAHWFMGLKPTERTAYWNTLGTFNRDA